VSFIPPSCPGSEASGVGGPDVEDHIFCDVDEDGEIIAYVLVSRTYDSAGNPGPPQFFDPFTSDPYVVQGTLAQCCCEAVSGGSGPSRFLNCETDSITICATDPIPVSISGGSFGPLSCETDSVTVCQGTNPWVVNEPDLPDFTGTWGYNAGVGTSVLVLSGSKRLIQISVIAGTSTAATFNVNGGDTITVPTNATFTFTPAVQLIDPTISFTDPAAWVVEWLS
jgi:hypothetical protein